jgi:homocysteine S-methyltransferase
LLIDQPEVVVAAHRSFVEAGADIVISSSYQASVGGFVRAGCSPRRARQLLLGTTELTRQSGARQVAASIGPYGATLGDGSEYHGRYPASWNEVRAFHRERIEVLADSGADLFAVETIPGSVEAEIILEELEARWPGQGWLAFSCSSPQHTCSGELFCDVVGRLRYPCLAAVGVNCSHPQSVSHLLSSARPRTDLPFVVYPNHGLLWDPLREDWSGHDPAPWTQEVACWVAQGARLVGGCCGIGPDEIALLVAMRDGLASGLGHAGHTQPGSAQNGH